MPKKKVDLNTVAAELCAAAWDDAVDRGCQLESAIAEGRQWVAERREGATPEVLTRLSELCDGLGANARHWFCDDASVKAYTTAERVFFILAPEHNGNRTEAHYFWEGVVADTNPAPWFVEGFVAGAAAEWEETKSGA